MTRRAGSLAIVMLLAPLAPSIGFTAEGPSPVAGYGSRLLHTGSNGVKDIVVRRQRDNALQLFRFRSDGTRDAPAIAAFLGDGAGRVERVFDQFGGHDLMPVAGTRGPMILAAIGTDGLPGLLFDNSGAFEGDVAAVNRPPYAVSLGSPGLPVHLAPGLTVLASLRLGNVASIAGGQVWEIGAQAPLPLAFMAGSADPARPEALSEDMSLLHLRNIDLSLPQPSTPAVFGVALNSAGVSVLSRGLIVSRPLSLDHDENWNDLLLGTNLPGAGEGFELDGLLLFDRRLDAAALRNWARLLAPRTVPGAEGTLVLDGSSVEAGVGSTGLRNQTRRYEPGLPGFEIDNVAVGGARTLDRIRALPATLRLLQGRPGLRLLLCAVGATTLASGTAPEIVYQQIGTYVRIAHAAVPGLKVGIATLIPSGYAIDLGRSAAFGVYNRLVLSNKAGADFISDRAADPVMGNPHRYRPIDTHISADGGHPTDFGHARLAAIDVAAIRRLLGHAPQ